MDKKAVVSEDIEMLAGRCLKTWAMVELSTTSLFLRLNDAEVKPIVGNHKHPLAAAFETIQSFRARLQVTNNFILADERTDDGHFRTAWNTLFKNLNKQRERRNQVAHYAILHNPLANPDRQYLLQPYFSLTGFYQDSLPKPLTHDMLCARNDSFSVTKERLVRFSQYLAVTRDNASIAGKPIVDPVRLLDNLNVRRPKET